MGAGMKLRSLLTLGISRGLLGFLGAGRGKEEHRPASDPWGWSKILAADTKRREASQPILRAKVKPQVARATGWKPSSPGVVSAFMPPMADLITRPRPASSYRGRRRNIARLVRLGEGEPA